MTKADLSELVERLRKATGPDRELDAAIWLVDEGYEKRGGFNPSTVFWTQVQDGFAMEGNSPMRSVPKFTASVDAALALVERVLPGWRHAHEKRTNGTCIAWVDAADDEPCIPSIAETIPLAILLSALTAIQSKGATDDPSPPAG